MSTAILILNWNGATDTLACLDSLLPNLGKDDYVFLIDNGSADNSIKQFEEYFLKHDLPLVKCAPHELINGFKKENGFYLIKNSRNAGFGGGNNVVLKQLVFLTAKMEYVWLLNNDTLVESKTLISLRDSLVSDPSCAVAGSLILNLPKNGTIQCSGVKHYKFFGVSKLINKNKELAVLNTSTNIDFDYLNGASLMFNYKALQEVGYFDERFFLYSEEFDLQLRLQEQGYQLKLDLNSVVYHKLSGGTSKSKYLFFYYYNMSAVLLSKKHFSIFYTLCALVNLTVITFIRAFPSFKCMYWGVKGIVKGLLK